MIVGELNLVDVGVTKELFDAISACICCIEIDLHPEGQGFAYGTGFLIAPDLVLTNYHVIEALFNNKNERQMSVPWALPEDVTFYFDRITEVAEQQVPQGTQATLHIDGWCESWSPTSTADSQGQPKLQPAQANELDYVVLRLSTGIGNQWLNRIKPRKRKWIKVSLDTSYSYREEETLHILQYPYGKALHLANAILMRSPLNETRTRIHYRVKASYGSSGSPCFNQDWELVAIHRARMHQDGRDDEREGIPIAAIVNHRPKEGAMLHEAINASIARNLGQETDPPWQKAIDEIIQSLHSQFPQLPSGVLMNLWNAIRTSQNEVESDFRIWLRKLSEIEVAPDETSWTFICAEYHLGAINMSDTPLSNYHPSPFKTIQYMYAVSARIDAHTSELEQLSPQIRMAPSSAVGNIVNAVHDAVDALRQELLLVLGFWSSYRLRIAIEVQERNTMLIKSLNRLAVSTVLASAYSPVELERGVSEVYQISDDLEQLRHSIDEFTNWLMQVALSAEDSLQPHVSVN